jgi:hypothetical protein
MRNIKAIVDGLKWQCKTNRLSASKETDSLIVSFRTDEAEKLLSYIEQKQKMLKCRKE